MTTKNEFKRPEAVTEVWFVNGLAMALVGSLDEVTEMFELAKASNTFCRASVLASPQDAYDTASITPLTFNPDVVWYIARVITGNDLDALIRPPLPGMSMPKAGGVNVGGAGGSGGPLVN